MEIFQRKSHCNFEEHHTITLHTNFQQLLTSTSEDISTYRYGQQIIVPDFRHFSNLNNSMSTDFQDMVAI